mmetsp:Transcript_38249/g.33799  ORF Transcript_38249/g.33799 Transcript_38249/m.33799 type:complete len:180 (-) Transcript_38249:108-647(-)
MNNSLFLLVSLLSYVSVNGQTHFEVWIKSIENDSGGKWKDLYANVICYGIDTADAVDETYYFHQTDAHDIDDGETRDYDFHKKFDDDDEIWFDYCTLQLLLKKGWFIDDPDIDEKRKDDVPITEEEKFIVADGGNPDADNWECDKVLPEDDEYFEHSFTDGEYVVKFQWKKYDGESCRD